MNSQQIKTKVVHSVKKINAGDVMDYLGQEVSINGVCYNLPSAEDLSCADLREGFQVPRAAKDQMGG